MSHPLIESQHLMEGRRGNDLNTINIKKNFIRMTILFAVNHGCAVSCLDLANARLGSIGVWQSGILYASYTLSALFGASYFVKKLGSRNGLILGMGMSATYVTSFFLISLIVEKGEGVGKIHEFVAVSSAIVGGVGASILWTSQGGYFTSASQLFASAEGGLVEDATSRFGGNFASTLLFTEVILRLLSTFFIETAGLSWRVIFALYTMLSILPVVLMLGVVDMEGYRYRILQSNYGSGSDEVFEEDNNSPSHKATATLDLLRKDPKAKYLSPLIMLFGLSTSFCSSVLNGAVIREVLNDQNSTFVGLFTAVTSIVAAGASLLFGVLQSSRDRFHCGKGPVMTIGALSYLTIALQFVAFPDGSDWNSISLLAVYILLGVGRATFEGTMRAIVADFFPNEKEGGFGNIILFSGTASTLGFLLSVTGTLTCEKVSKYCLAYNDGSIHNVLVMEAVIIGTAIIAIPGFWRAVGIFRKEQSIQNSSV